MAVLSVVLVFSCLFGAGRAAGAQDASRHPILLELFTSEGCSSCPPVDAWLQRVDAAQPVPGVQIVVLSEHVDYWDQDGWKDPYSLAMVTERQREYAQGLGLKDVYTPQVILNGSTVLGLTDPKAIEQAMEKAAAAPAVAVQIESASVEAGKPDVLQGHIQALAGSPQQRGDVYVVVALDHTDSSVLRGENSGRKLSNVAVVEQMVKIGKLEKGKNFARDFQIKLKPGTDPSNLRVVAFVQEPNLGRVLGVAMKKDLH
jgi:hypothetical protein